ncbi:BrxE family protein [Thauera aromatica]|uniref:BrxE family protein n=1 Tax=Thauera aromatica TaxID=59405 RepID=UPI001FFD0BDC|nr:BrxE family protein [Thauera aromatica]MCK2088625.1 BrxE family protein [Thauera aromatica]
MIQNARFLTELRILVGYLGEQAPAWWLSRFFSPNAAAFLGPVFARTLFLAQCRGVTTAAARLHDEHIGIGRSFHLFRLPEGLEQVVAATLADPGFEAGIRPQLDGRDQALARLASLGTVTAAAEGPVSLGAMAEDPASQLETIAGLYADAFSKGIQTFPYLREA